MPAGVDIKKYADDILNYIIGNNISADLPQQIVDAVQLWRVCNASESAKATPASRVT